MLQTRRCSAREVLLDATQITIAFKNLLRNARDAMSEGGILALSTDVTTDSVKCYVSDNGIGINDDDIDIVFEPLFSTKARGMGLGLSITKSIVEKNEGTLTVEGKLGAGSTFCYRTSQVRTLDLLDNSFSFSLMRTRTVRIRTSFGELCRIFF